MQRCRLVWVEQLPTPPRNILLLGEGPGRALTELRRRFPEAQIACLDASAAMLQRARAHLHAAGLSAERVAWIHADALTWEPEPGAYDLLVANFFFDCFRADQLERLIPKLARVAAPGAHFLVADFHHPATGRLARWRSRVIVKILYLFFRAATRLPAHELVPVAPLLERAGFRLQRAAEFDWGLLRSEWWRHAPAQ